MDSTTKFDKSQELLKRAKNITPLGAQTYSKSYRYFYQGHAPSFIERGEGARVWDVDNNEFLDFICALGPITVGYNDPGINNEIIRQLNKGIVFSQPSPLTIELAELIKEVVPCAEMVRFLKNGSDATSAAIRLARAYTNRNIVAACGYHGMQDWYISSTNNNKGIPDGIKKYTKTWKYNDIESLRDLFNTYKNEIAAVILEPIQANGPETGFLQEVKGICEANGTLLIFDEVVSGFRYALGGASELFDINPDMAAIGKGMANGMPISAVVGKKEIMKLIEEGVFISTTFGGDALSISAAIATINRLKDKDSYKKIWSLGEMMHEGLREIIDRYSLHDFAETYGLPPHCGISFNDTSRIEGYTLMALYQKILLEDGILSIGINNLSLAHSEKDIEMYLKSSDRALKYIQKVLDENNQEAISEAQGKYDPIFKRNNKRN